MPNYLAFLGVILASQTVSETTPSKHLFIGKQAYLASPAVAVKTVSPDEQYRWSTDGSRLVYVSTLLSDSPGQIAARIAKGQTLDGPIRVGVWSRDSGRARDVFNPTTTATSIGGFVFIGRDLVFSSSTDKDGVSVQNLWIVPDGGSPRMVDLPGWDGAGKLLSANKRPSLLVAGTFKAWILDSSRTVEVALPGKGPFYGRGVTADDRGIIYTNDADGKSIWHLVNFANASVQTVTKEPVEAGDVKTRPFILDSYRLEGRREALDEDDPAMKAIDASPRGFMQDEDGGWRLDLVERTGEKRRRLPFIPEMARYVNISDDGLSFAYVSNRMLMVRWLIKADAATSAKLAPPPG